MELPFQISQNTTIRAENFLQSFALLYFKKCINLVIVYAGYNQSESMRHIEVRLFQGTEQLLCDELSLECDEKHKTSMLVVKNAIFHHRWFKRQFNSLKADNHNELPFALQNTGREKILQLEQQMKNQMNIIELLEKRTSAFHYSLGEIQKFTFNDRNYKAYIVRENILYRQVVDYPRQNRHQKADFQKGKLEKMHKSIISTKPIDPRNPIVSFQIIVQRVSSTNSKSAPFIGLCTKNRKTQQDIIFERQDQFTFIIPQGSRQEIQQLNDYSMSTLRKTSLCDLYYMKVSHDKNATLMIGDTLTMTVDFEKRHITWYRNEKSIERSYFELPEKVDIYPFIYLEPDTKVTF